MATIKGDEDDNVLTGDESGVPEDDRIKGRGGDDELNGLGGDDILNGGGGEDDLDGGKGDDVLIGGADGDVLDGGDGVDEADYSDSSDDVSVNLALGIGSDGAANGDTLIGIENVTGSNDGFGDDLTGNGGANVLKGLDGDDSLVGGDGGDTLVGGAGSDSVSYGLSDAGVTVNLAAGTASGGDAEGDTLKGIERFFGSDFGDRAIGNGSANFLLGRAGDDRLNGKGGDDLLIGSAGADRLNGGDGADTFFYQKEEDSEEGGGFDLIKGFAGEDVIDIRAIDADTTTVRDQRFTFIEGDGFSGMAGELRFEVNGDTTRLLGDTDGDGDADLRIDFTGAVTFAADDFIL